jgi:hypothetical protein
MKEYASLWTKDAVKILSDKIEDQLADQASAGARHEQWDFRMAKLYMRLAAMHFLFRPAHMVSQQSLAPTE